jgi:hypothetical protein
MPLSPELAQWLRAEGHDAVHANELSMNASPDSEILQAATNAGRVVITADLHFPRLLAQLGSAGPGADPVARELRRSREPGLCAARPDVGCAGGIAQIHCRGRQRKNTAALAPYLTCLESDARFRT